MKAPVLESWEYCEIFKNTYFEEHLRIAASSDTQFLSVKIREILERDVKGSIHKSGWTEVTAYNLNKVWARAKSCHFKNP